MFSPGIVKSANLNATGTMTVRTEIKFINEAISMTAPCDQYFFCLIIIKPTISKPNAINCIIKLNSLLNGADVFSKLAM